MKRILFILLSILLLFIAYPKVGISIVAWIAFVPFFIVLENTHDMKEMAWLSFFFGLCYSLVLFYWILSLFVFIGVWAIICWIALSVFYCLAFVIFGVALFYFKDQGFIIHLLSYPV